MSGLAILIAIIVIVLLWSQFRPGRSSPLGRGNSARQLSKRVGKQAAKRLIQQVQRSHPDRSRDWCADKALFDLERDRRY